jgi:hypothetical protein
MLLGIYDRALNDYEPVTHGTTWTLVSRWTSALLRRRQPGSCCAINGSSPRDLRYVKRAKGPRRARDNSTVRGNAALMLRLPVGSRGGALRKMMVISRSHQARMSLSQRSHKNGSAKGVCGADDCKLTQDRTTDTGRRPVSQASRALLAALHHSRLLPLWPRCHRNIRARHQTSVHRVCCPVACSIV